MSPPTKGTPSRGQRFQPRPGLGCSGGELRHRGRRGQHGILPKQKSPGRRARALPNTRFWAESAGGGDAAVRPALPGAEAGGLPKPDGLPPLGPTVSRFRLARAKQIGAKPSPTPPAEGGTQAGHATGPFCGRGHVQAALTGCAPPGKEQGAGLGLCLRQKLRTFSPDLMRNLVISSAPLYCKAP